MKIDALYMDQDIPLDEESRYLLARLPVEPIRVPDSTPVYNAVNQAKDPVSHSKKILYITRNRGAVVRQCPGTCEYTCCDYTILHSGTFCTMDCSYCILQAYFHPPVLQYFYGFDQYTVELEQIFSQDRIYRVGTGEFTDSLIWEPVSLLPRFLIKRFARQTNSILELKTKTINIDSLLSVAHNRKTILAWSVNTPFVIKTQERGTAGLKARIKAAARAQAHGYLLAFHFDPMVVYPGCETDYENVVDLIFETIDPASVVWISVGSFRFMPQLKGIIDQRFPESAICCGEFIPGLDGKMRYFKPIRIRLYRRLIQRIYAWSTTFPVYFCMEDQEVWEKCTGYFPGQEGELGHILDQSAAARAGLKKTGL